MTHIIEPNSRATALTKGLVGLEDLLMWEIIRQKTDIRVKFIQLLSFSKFLLSIYYAPSTIVGNDNTAVTKRYTILPLVRLDLGGT